jgi:hypothetical protein
MKTGTLVLSAAVGILVLTQLNPRKKKINIIKRNPAGLLSESSFMNLEKLTDLELEKMKTISLKIEQKVEYTQEEAVFFGSMIKKYNL